ncbi:MAG: anthranilate phosphoribosyltransferase [Geminicoccaceae bacterium]
MSTDVAAFRELLGIVAAGRRLTLEQARDAFDTMMSGDATPSQMGGFLMALRVRGESVDELTAGATVMRERMLRVQAPETAIDTCGTGGDGAHTLNISTAAAIVLAAAGVPVAKHGNRGLSSRSGSSDVLTELGVNIDLEPDAISRCISQANIGFMMAPRHHGAMRHVAGTRVELGTRTIFNLLGPLCNPAGVRRQVLGVFAKSWIEPLAQVLGKLGSERVWVVHGGDGTDELTTTTVTHVAELVGGTVRTFDLSPEDAGLQRSSPEQLRGGAPSDNARALLDLLEGKPSAYRDAALFAAAGGLLIADKVTSLADGVAAAGTAIDDGRAKGVLNRLVEVSAANG